MSGGRELFWWVVGPWLLVGGLVGVNWVIT
jgi:hypothetical protein